LANVFPNTRFSKSRHGADRQGLAYDGPARRLDVASEALMPELARFIEYNTSCAADFIQPGAIATLEPERGELFTIRLVENLAISHNRLAPGSAFGPEGERWLRWCRQRR
jgi:hypothetical protein